MKKTFLLIAVTLFFFCLGAPLPTMAANIGGVDIHGFVSQGFLSSGEYNYIAHNSKEGSFEYSEMAVNFARDLTDKMRVGVQLFSRDIGDAGNHKITLDWAYGDYAFKDWLGLRFGKIRMPQGLYNETRDLDMLRTSIVMPQGIYNELFRDNTIALSGASVYGNVGLGPLGYLNYQIIQGTANTDLDSGVGKFVESRIGSQNYGSAKALEIDNKGATCLSFIWETPLNGLRLGYTKLDIVTETPARLATIVAGPVTMDVILTQLGRNIIQTASAEYTWNNLVVAAEYMHRESEIDVTTNMSPAIDRFNIKTESYYLSASYRFTDLFTLGAYYAEYYPDAGDKDGDDLPIDHNAWEKDLALTLRFDLNPYWVLKLEGHSVNGTANVLFIDNADSDYDEEDWYYGAAKVTVSF